MGRKLFTLIFRFLWSITAEISFYLLIAWCFLLAAIKLEYLGWFQNEFLDAALVAIYNVPLSVHLTIILAVLLALSFFFGFVGMVDRIRKEVIELSKQRKISARNSEPRRQ